MIPNRGAVEVFCVSNTTLWCPSATCDGQASYLTVLNLNIYMCQVAILLVICNDWRQLFLRLKKACLCPSDVTLNMSLQFFQALPAIQVFDFSAEEEVLLCCILYTLSY